MFFPQSRCGPSPRLANFSAEDLLRSAPVPLTGGRLATSRYQPGSSQQTCDSAASSLSSTSSAPPPSPGPCSALSPPSFSLEPHPGGGLVTPPGCSSSLPRPPSRPRRPPVRNTRPGSSRSFLSLSQSLTSLSWVTGWSQLETPLEEEER